MIQKENYGKRSLRLTIQPFQDLLEIEEDLTFTLNVFDPAGNQLTTTPELKDESNQIVTAKQIQKLAPKTDFSFYHRCMILIYSRWEQQTPTCF